MKKYSRHYLRRCLSVLLAVVMVCAAAQTLVFAVDLGENDITPGWQQGTARARYTTSGTLEITFPESTKSDADYYAEFYDLDGNDRETPVVEAFQLNTARTYADDTTQIGATLDRSWVESSGLDMSHRISIAITAVSSDGWRSEAIEALVGESLDVPQAGASPDGSDTFVSFADFNVGSNTQYDAGAYSGSTPSWLYNDSNYSNGLQEGQIPTNPDGVFGGGGTTPNADLRYDTPGFDSSSAFRMYVRETTEDYQTLDLMYNQDHWQFTNAEELWIWVDTSYVEFDELAFEVRYMDYTGTQRYDRKQNTENHLKSDLNHVYSEDTYSTVGYAMRNSGSRIPVYYINEDGLWDVMYMNSAGYLTNFGHYRGFLRVPVEYLQNENVDESQYITLSDTRPRSFNIQIGYFYLGNFWDTGEDNYLRNISHNNISAAELLKDPSQLTWQWRDLIGQSWTNETFDREKFENATTASLEVTPIEDIASVGIKWKCTDDGSTSKPFYIDQIGFSGTNLTTNTSSAGIVGKLNEIGMISSDEEAVNQLIEQYIPDGLVSVSNAGIVEDLEAICDRLGLSYPAKLKEARATLDALLSGSADIVSYVETQLNRSDTLSSEQIAELYEVYRGLTLGEIHRLGVTNERKLIDLYNERGSNEWFPNSALNGVYFKAFNDVEMGYSVGDAALHEYDDYNLAPDGSVHYYDRGHILDWSKGEADMRQAWENSRNLIAYSRIGYDDTVNSTNQRFGYGITTVGQNGFANSKSIDTDIYRDAIRSGNNVENYRISLTYNGDDTSNWDTLEKGNFAGADDFTFYADFSNLKEIRKMWTTIRTSNGTIYSHDETNLEWQYQAFSLDNPGAGWQTMNSVSDGCLNTGLVGFRGFIRIPISVFKQIGGSATLTDDLSSVGQVKVFLSGNPDDGVSEAGSAFVLDMFGFISNEQEGSFTQTLEQQYHHAVELPTPVQNATAQFEAQLNELFVEETDINNNPIQLFDVSKTDAYTALVAAYNTMTLSEKENADDTLKKASGGKYTGVDELQLFVKNYDSYGMLGEGNLKRNADTATGLRTDVENAFTAGNPVNSISAIDSIFETYQNYPDYSKYSVQTYWPDRNLHAVFPNYNPEDVWVGNSETNPVGFELQGDSYTAVVTIPYVGAVSADNYMNFKWPENFELTDASNEKVTASITPAGAVVNVDGTISLTLTVPYASVKNQGTYKGAFTIDVDKDPDTGTAQVSNSNPVTDANKYRDTITIYAELVCQPEFTVTIPADTGVEWDSLSTPMEGYEVTECSLPNGAYIEMSVASTDGEYAMAKTIEGKEFTIPYTLSGSGSETVKRFNSETGTIDLNIDVDAGEWYKPIAEDYRDTLVFTVSYHEATN